MFDNILVPLDGSTLAEGILPHTVAVARAFGARVTLLRTLGPTDDVTARGSDALDWNIQAAEGEAYLSELCDNLQEAGLQTAHELVQGTTAAQALAFGNRTAGDLVMVSSHGQEGLAGWNIGGDMLNLILQATVSVMIVRTYQSAAIGLTDLSYHRLLLPLDGSLRAEHSLSAAVSLARFHSSVIVLATIVSKPAIPRRRPLTSEEIELANRITDLNRLDSAEYLKELHGRLSADQLTVKTHLVMRDDMVEALHELAHQEDIDLVVLSAHGHHGGTASPYGSTPANFIFYGTAPLLIVQDLDPSELKNSEASLASRPVKGH